MRALLCLIALLFATSAVAQTNPNVRLDDVPVSSVAPPKIEARPSPGGAQTREDIMALPSVIRARDNASPVNSRQSALERDIAKQRQAEIDRENAAVDAMMEEQLRLYSALRQDLE